MARRKKRAAEKEKEKGKKKGGKGDAGANGNTEQGENGAGGDVEEGEVKWEDKVAVLCTVRANAKVKSFSVGPNEGLKGGVPVRPSSPYSAEADDSCGVLQQYQFSGLQRESQGRHHRYSSPQSHRTG